MLVVVLFVFVLWLFAARVVDRGVGFGLGGVAWVIIIGGVRVCIGVSIGCDSRGGQQFWNCDCFWFRC